MFKHQMNEGISAIELFPIENQRFSAFQFAWTGTSWNGTSEMPSETNMSRCEVLKHVKWRPRHESLQRGVQDVQFGALDRCPDTGATMGQVSASGWICGNRARERIRWTGPISAEVGIILQTVALVQGVVGGLAVAK